MSSCTEDTSIHKLCATEELFIEERFEKILIGMFRF